MGNKVPHSFYGPDAREETFFIVFRIWLPQAGLSSTVTPSDLAVETLITGKSLIANVGETVRVLNLGRDLTNMNSVLVYLG